MSINFPTVNQFNEDGTPVVYEVHVGYPLEDDLVVYLTTLETYGNREGKIFFHTVDGEGITLYESKIESITISASDDETIDAEAQMIEDSINDAAFMSDKPVGLWLYTERPTIRGLLLMRLRTFWEDFRQI